MTKATDDMLNREDSLIQSNGVTFAPSRVGSISLEDNNEAWDDGAILKAFDDALRMHNRPPTPATPHTKDGDEVAISAEDSVMGVVGQGDTEIRRGEGGTREPATCSSSVGGVGGRAEKDEDQYAQADKRFMSLLEKGKAEARRELERTAGIAGPWEPVIPSKEKDNNDQRSQGSRGLGTGWGLGQELDDQGANAFATERFGMSNTVEAERNHGYWPSHDSQNLHWHMSSHQPTLPRHPEGHEWSNSRYHSQGHESYRGHHYQGWASAHPPPPPPPPPPYQPPRGAHSHAKQVRS
ncbi:unnamed protein product [Choristocarpus tenellus]